MTLEPLDLMLIVLCIAAVWAIFELAMTLRKARTAIDEISHSATEAIDQATPIIAKLDGVVDDLQPTLQEVTPLVEKASVTLDRANVGLGAVNGILGDVSSTTHGIAGVGESASRIVNTATSAAVGVVSKVASLGGINIPEGQQLIGKGASEPEAEPVDDVVVGGTPAPAETAEEEAPVKKSGYVTYAPVKSQDDADDAEE